MEQDCKRLEELLRVEIGSGPKLKAGLLLSGGVDSTTMGALLKKAGVRFSCYTAVFEHEDLKEASDLDAAKKAADFLRAKLYIANVNLEGAEEAFREVALIVGQEGVGGNQIVHASVGAAVYIALKKAREEGVKVVYTGMGADEIFGGYACFRDCEDLKAESIQLLGKLWEEDYRRDVAIAKALGIEVKTPYLAQEVVEFALALPVERKIYSEKNKIILRELAKDLGVPNEIVERAKKAAQYGSAVDKALEKLVKREGMKNKTEYIESLKGSEISKRGKEGGRK